MGNRGMFGVPQAQVSDQFWHQEPDSQKAAQALLGEHRKLRENQRDRIEADILHMSLYAGRRLSGYGIGTYWKAVQTTEPAVGAGLAVNIIKNASNAVVSKIGKNRPKPSPVTDDAERSTMERAENLERFLYGAFYTAGVHDLDLRWLLVSTVLGTGHIVAYRTDDPMDKESEPGLMARVALPGAVTVDDFEGIDGKPMTLMERQYDDKARLVAKYAKGKDAKKIRAAILSASLPSDELSSNYTKNNQAQFVESWRLPSAPIRRDSKGNVINPKEEWGRHMVALDGKENACLKDEPYFWDRFPHVALRYDDELLGYWGCGVAYQGFGYQSEINGMLIKAQQAMRLLAVPHIFVDRAAQMNTNEWTNEIGTFVEGNFAGAGGMPQVITPQLFGPEFYGHMERLRGWFFDDLGISQMMAQGQKPAGITAAVALDAITDSDTERHVRLSRRWEQAHVDLGNRFIDFAKQINGGDAELGYVKKEYAVVWHGADTLGKMKWADVDMERDQFVLKVQASSALPDSLSARKQFLTDLRNQGDIDQGEYLQGLNLGEYKSATRRKTAAERYLGKVAEALHKGKYISPEPDDNLQLAVTYMTAELQMAKTKDDVTDETLQLFRDYLLAVKQMLTPPAPPPPPPGPPMAGGDVPPPDMTGAPMAPPMPPAGAPMGAPN